MLDRDFLEDLRKRGLKVTPEFDRACYRVEFRGVVFPVADVDLRYCRTQEEILDLLRERYVAIGGKMKVIQVIVRKKNNRTKLRDAGCVYVEAYPGDYRWLCAQCLLPSAWVKPKLESICPKCGAWVSCVVRQNKYNQMLTQKVNGDGTMTEDFDYYDTDGKRQRQTQNRVITAQDRIEQATKKVQRKERERMERMLNTPPDDMRYQREIERIRTMMAMGQINSTMAIRTDELRNLDMKTVIYPIKEEPKPEPEPKKPEILPEPRGRKFRVVPDSDDE